MYNACNLDAIEICKITELKMFSLFTRYISVGVINTLIHWVTFAIGIYLFGINQMLSNLIAFSISVTFSFFANARWTFKSQASLARYIMFVFFMSLVALLTGYIADRISLLPILTLIIFSSLSLVIGFYYSKLVVFRESK
jgi:putative flippase GtrA